MGVPEAITAGVGDGVTVVVEVGVGVVVDVGVEVVETDGVPAGIELVGMRDGVGVEPETEGRGVPVPTGRVGRGVTPAVDVGMAVPEGTGDAEGPVVDVAVVVGAVVAVGEEVVG